MTDTNTPDLVTMMTVQLSDKPDYFVGQSDIYGQIGVYGGHFVGQALSAAFQTIDAEKWAQSFHAYFVAAGDPSVQIEYRVKRLREGRGSEIRSIEAWQHDHWVFQMTASFKLPEDSDEHQPVMPEVLDPEELRKQAVDEDISFNPPPTKNGWSEMLLASDHFVQPEYKPGREAVLKLWMRCPQTNTLTSRESQVLLAFLSDGPLMFNSVIPHGLPFQTHRLTSLDHSAWFHRPCDVSNWMFFDQHSSAAADGRGMNHGTIFDTSGRLLMTVAQESMLRRITKK